MEGHSIDKRQLRFHHVDSLVFTAGYARKEAQVHADMRLVSYSDGKHKKQYEC